MILPALFVLIQNPECDADIRGDKKLTGKNDNGFDLIILDLMMPKIDGLQACMKIREFSNVPIIMLTARSEDADKIIGFKWESIWRMHA